MDLEEAYDNIKREAVWQVLRMYNGGRKLLNGIKSMYVNSLTCVRVKGGESECFRINIGVRWVYHVPLASQCVYGCRDEEETREWR